MNTYSRPIWLVALLSAIYLAYTLGLAVVAQKGFPEGMRTSSLRPFLSDKPINEDGFYMLVVSWNLGEGRGLTYNYNKPTTGIQPLMTIITGGLAWIVQKAGGDKWLFIRWVIISGALLAVLFAHLIGKIAASIDERLYVLAFTLALFNLGLFRLFTYGLELGLYLVMIATCVLYSLNFEKKEKLTLKDALIFGALAGLTGLTRLDFGLVFFVFLVVSILRRKLSLSWVMVTGVVAALIASTWLIYVHQVTGGWIPSSGRAQSSLIAIGNVGERLLEMSVAIIGHLFPLIYTAPGTYFGPFLSLIALAVLLFLLIVKRQEFRLVMRAFKDQSILSSWLIAFLLLVPVYTIFFWATHFYSRYTAPLTVVSIPALALFLSLILKSRRGEFAALGLIVICFFIWAIMNFHMGRIGNSHAVTAGYLRREFPDVKIGAFQSGAIGYFNPNVLNLDGKIDAQALEALTKGTMYEYIDRENIQVLVDWDYVIENMLPQDYLKTQWKPCPLPIPNGRSICLERIKRQ